MPSSRQELLRKLPSVDVVLRDPELGELAAAVPRRILVDCVRTSIEEIRGQLAALAADYPDQGSIHAAIVAEVRRRTGSAVKRHYRKAINATGIILHTALGRAVLPSEALRQIEEELAGYSLLQADAETGRRSQRDARIEWLLQQLTGAEAAAVVNNNAAATMIVLNTVACGREVIVSRGQLVEIGGSFRLPDVMAASGAKLVEVGTTNKTHAKDYAKAVTDDTAAILRVHPSNYKISGFTSEVSLEELERIAHANGLVLIDDIGAGSLVDLSRFGFDPEPTLPESVRTGADLVTASADKLIGACQGGIILGGADWLRRIRENPLARIVRVGKLTLTALEATLKLFLDEAVALREVPTLRMLRRELSEIAEQAERIASGVRGGTSKAAVTVIDGFSQMGSGSLPAQGLATRLVAVDAETIPPGEFAARLRGHSPPIFTRVHKGRVFIDPRTLLEGEEAVVIAALVDVFERGV